MGNFKIHGFFGIALFFLCCFESFAASNADIKAGLVPDQSFDGWRVMPVRSEDEFKQGMTGGEAEQHCQGIARSRSKPEIIYLSHDCGQVWRSANSGTTWKKTLGKNLYVIAGQSIEVDPFNPDIVFVIMDNTWDWMNEKYQGLYCSHDGGDTWEFVLPVATELKNSRRYEHNIAYDITSVSGGKAARWYVAFSGDALYRFGDAGKSWEKSSSLEDLGHIYVVQTHPFDGRTVYLGSEKGFFVSHDRGSSLHAAGNIPAGEITSIAIDEKQASIVYAALRGAGLYKSSDGGRSFELLKKFPAEHIFLNPAYPGILYLTGARDSICSLDAGNTWNTISLKPAQGLRREYKKRMVHALTGVVPNPRSPLEAVAYTQAAIWKSEDAIHFKDSSTLFTGYNPGWWNNSIGFDLKNPDRFALFNADVGMVITDTRGDFFYRRGVPIEWRNGLFSKIPWTSMHGAGLQPGTNTIVSSVGNTWKKKLVRSEDSGQTWTIVDDDLCNNLFISFNPSHKNIVYADNKKSVNSGETFELILFLKDKNADIVGMCRAQPDTIYAMDKRRTIIFRSDDQGTTWREYAAPGWNFCRHDSKPTFAVDPENRDMVYSIDARGDLALFDGKNWSSLGLIALAGSDNPKNFARSVEIDPNHSEIIYAGMHTPGTSTMWRSMNRGKTWQDITFNLPRLSISGININPHSGEVMVGGCCGTWVFPPPYPSSHGIYKKLFSMPSCHDGLKNGDEAQADCGGSCKEECK